MSVGTGAELGYRSCVVFGNESTYGTAPTTAAMVSDIVEVDSVGLSIKIEEQKQEELNSTRSFSRRLQLNKTVDGTIEKSLHPVAGIIPFRHALGGTITTTAGSTGVYVHTFALGDGDLTSIQTTTGAYTSFTADVRKGPTRGMRYTGLRVNQMTISGEIGQPIKVSYECIGQNAASQTTAIADSAITFSAIRPFLFKDVSYQYASLTAGLTTTVTEQLVGFELTVNNNIAADTRALGTDTVVALPPGKRDISLKLKMRADTSTVFERYASGVVGAAKLVIEGPSITDAANQKLTFTFPSVYYNAADPEIGDSGVIFIEPEVTVMNTTPNTTTSYDFQVQLQNGTANYA